MYMKIIGSVLVIAFSTVAGFKLGNNYKERIAQLKMVKQFLILLRGEIRYHKTPIDEALKNILGRSGDKIDIMLNTVLKGIKENDKREFKEIWRDGIIELKNNSDLSREELNRLLDFGENIGFLDVESQISNIDLYLESLDEDIKSLTSKTDEKCKIYNVCGILTGIFIVLLIV
ncbi:stage III sporulation protein AB [Falcatimonas sp. MSJ-15]|uniref:stage III sporulation protein AB n=1 Tax=Falcatimonas sp. MSJ-15 TaxID=2841515 RepID=UPI001C0FE30B|nr:stage III sporulation protein AB [Falcatimonas sp. MSJ-15]MBU5471487.1 stage III sporulation protein AB [Falcatimonas sp. MSJ-15]